MGANLGGFPAAIQVRGSKSISSGEGGLGHQQANLPLQELREIQVGAWMGGANL